MVQETEKITDRKRLDGAILEAKKVVVSVNPGENNIPTKSVKTTKKSIQRALDDTTKHIKAKLRHYKVGRSPVLFINNLT